MALVSGDDGFLQILWHGAQHGGVDEGLYKVADALKIAADNEQSNGIIACIALVGVSPETAQNVGQGTLSQTELIGDGQVAPLHAVFDICIYPTIVIEVFLLLFGPVSVGYGVLQE